MSENRQTTGILSVTKYVLLVILLLYIGFVVSQNKSSSRPFSEIADSVSEEDWVKGMQEGNGQSFKRFYGMNASDFEDILFYYPGESMGVNEMLLAKVKNAEQMDSLMNAVDERIKNQEADFKGYGKEQTELLSKAVVKKQGNLLFFVVSPKAEQIKEKFLEAL